MSAGAHVTITSLRWDHIVNKGPMTNGHRMVETLLNLYPYTWVEVMKTSEDELVIVADDYLGPPSWFAGREPGYRYTFKPDPTDDRAYPYWKLLQYVQRFTRRYGDLMKQHGAKPLLASMTSRELPGG
jgi:hypothetical protein